MANFPQCGCRLGSEGGGTTSSKSDPQLRHNDDEETKATTPRQRLSSGAAEAEKQVKSTCQRSAASNVHETRTRVDVVLRDTRFENSLKIRNGSVRFDRFVRLIRNEFSGRACVKVKTKLRIKMSTVHEFP